VFATPFVKLENRIAVVLRILADERAGLFPKRAKLEPFGDHLYDVIARPLVIEKERGDALLVARSAEPLNHAVPVRSEERLIANVATEGEQRRCALSVYGVADALISDARSARNQLTNLLLGLVCHNVSRFSAHPKEPHLSTDARHEKRCPSPRDLAPLRPLRSRAVGDAMRVRV